MEGLQALLEGEAAAGEEGDAAGFFLLEFFGGFVAAEGGVGGFDGR